ncbi:polygalacturonase-like [Solanum verrucosum]|uniref:polygalacturonase-like n=1 Tax=Solanum verrucosum TaxID=315347 RepID=UPI0020D1129B|nr:polygalacturonase-like [Solanum verrucosum]
MTLLRNPFILFTIFIIIIMSFSSCYSIKFLDDDHNINNLEEEFGNDFHFKAYPSNYFNTILDHEKNNNMKKNLEIISRFQRFKNLEKLDEEQNQAKVITISVDRFGAKGDGKIDDTNAFQKAWKEVCSSSNVVNFVVSKNKKYLLKPIKFSGPCKSSITMQIYGTLLASDDTSNYNKDSRHWLIFDSVQKLVVGGAGVINGNGKIWWQNSCKINKKLPCKVAPTALTFYKCNNLKVKDLKIEDAQQIHLLIEKCVVVEVSKLVVSSPENSPNTDGIHITNTQNIQISDSTIATGDDCISIVDGSQKVLATSITCGPGHGISIGSLGGGNSEAHVSDIHVNGAKLFGTTNGLRIKTWPGGFGSASNIKFQNVVMNNVKNPIIIDQNYCDQADGPCKAETDSAIQVKNVIYQNIKGTSATNDAINFNCSKKIPCQGILLENVKLLGGNGETPNAIWGNINNLTCSNVLPECKKSQKIV